jgi:hypothetical protein
VVLRFQAELKFPESSFLDELAGRGMVSTDWIPASLPQSGSKYGGRILSPLMLVAEILISS